MRGARRYFSRLALVVSVAIAGLGARGASRQSCVAPPSGLLSWWAGDGNSLEIVGGNNGVLVGGVTFVPGQVGQAFSLDGVSGLVLVTNSPSLDDVSQFTVAAWVRPTAASGEPDCVGIIINKEISKFSSGDVQYELGRRNNRRSNSGNGLPAGNLAIYLGGVTGLPNDADGWVDGYGALPLNVWTHVGLSYDRATVRVFVDGVLTRSINVGGSANAIPGKLRLGGRTSPPPEACFAGLIDEACVFNRALTTNELAGLYSAGKLGMCKPLSLVERWLPPNVDLSFQSVPDQNYIVQQNTNLATTNWVYFTNLLGNGSLLHITAPAMNARQNFFRVERR